MATTTRHHDGQQLAGEVSQADDVGIDHLQPIGKIRFVCGFQTQGQTCIVHQHIYRLPFAGHVLQHRIDVIQIAHIHLQWEKAGTQFLLQVLQALQTARRTDDFVTFFHQQTACGFTKTR